MPVRLTRVGADESLALALKNQLLRLRQRGRIDIALVVKLLQIGRLARFVLHCPAHHAPACAFGQKADDFVLVFAVILKAALDHWHLQRRHIHGFKVFAGCENITIKLANITYSILLNKFILIILIFSVNCVTIKFSKF